MALPPTPPGRLPVGLCVFGLTYACGFTWSDTPRRNLQPLTARQIIDRAAADGLGWVEMPSRLLGDLSLSALEELRTYARERSIAFVMAGSNLLSGSLETDLQAASRLKARTLRCTLSSVLCGDRRGFPAGWREHLKRCGEVLEKLVPQAERLRIALALENHQDADSDDLLALCGRFESPYLGVTLDTGNPLAVMEHPVRFAERLRRYLRHAHLKDYRIYHAPNGYRLVRCAMGEGVIPFAELFRVLDTQVQPITRCIEMAALNARQIPMLERTWWDEYGPRDARDTLPALELVWNHLRPEGEDFRTPLEREATGEELLRYEWEQHEKSVAFLKATLAG